ncbi:hypothetical protein D3C71_1259680 [compost metagenome]
MLDAVDPTPAAPEKPAAAPVARVDAAPVVQNGQLFGSVASEAPASTDAAAQAAQAEAREDIPTDVAQADEDGKQDQEKNDKA